MQNNTTRDSKLEEDFLLRTGLSLEKARTLYQQAVENDWRTVQATTQQAFGRFSASRALAFEAADLLALAEAIRKGEPTKSEPTA